MSRKQEAPVNNQSATTAVVPAQRRTLTRAGPTVCTILLLRSPFGKSFIVVSPAAWVAPSNAIRKIQQQQVKTPPDERHVSAAALLSDSTQGFSCQVDFHSRSIFSFAEKGGDRLIFLPIARESLTKLIADKSTRSGGRTLWSLHTDMCIALKLRVRAYTASSPRALTGPRSSPSFNALSSCHLSMLPDGL